MSNLTPLEFAIGNVRKFVDRIDNDGPLSPAESSLYDALVATHSALSLLSSQFKELNSRFASFSQSAETSQGEVEGSLEPQFKVGDRVIFHHSDIVSAGEILDIDPSRRCATATTYRVEWGEGWDDLYYARELRHADISSKAEPVVESEVRDENGEATESLTTMAHEALAEHRALRESPSSVLTVGDRVEIPEHIKKHIRSILKIGLAYGCGNKNAGEIEKLTGIAMQTDHLHHEPSCTYPLRKDDSKRLDERIRELLNPRLSSPQEVTDDAE